MKRKPRDFLDDHVKFYKKFADDAAFQEFFVDEMFRRYLREREADGE